MNEQELFQAMKDQKKESKHEKGYFYTAEKLEQMRITAMQAGYKKGYDDCLKTQTDTQQTIYSINTAMYLIDNFRCKGQGLEKYFDYMHHMEELRQQGQYDLIGQIKQINEETGVQILPVENEEAKLVIEFLDLGEKEFYKKHPEVKINKLLKERFR